MQGCVVHRGMKNVFREPSWCRPNPEYHEPPCSLLNLQIREQVNNVRIVVSPYFADRATSVVAPRMENPTDIIGYCLNTNYVLRFRCEDNNGDLVHVQPQYYRVRQVEPCHRFG